MYLCLFLCAVCMGALQNSGDAGGAFLGQAFMMAQFMVFNGGSRSISFADIARNFWNKARANYYPFTRYGVWFGDNFSMGPVNFPKPALLPNADATELDLQPYELGSFTWVVSKLSWESVMQKKKSSSRDRSRSIVRIQSPYLYLYRTLTFYTIVYRFFDFIRI